jgi:Protein of unknown function (DUF4019)
MARCNVAIVCVVWCLALGLSAAAGAPEDDAQAAAESWLTLVDKGSYSDSWEQAATIFKNAVKKDEWNRAVATARGPLGKLESRKLKSRKYTERLPGAPDGQYVVIQYDTYFENKSAAVETITPMMDADGTWRVSGYFVR